jgi:hypothetical protein
LRVRADLATGDGTAAITAPGPTAQLADSADPVAFLLASYGRTGQWGQIGRDRIVPVGAGRGPGLHSAD